MLDRNGIVAAGVLALVAFLWWRTASAPEPDDLAPGAVPAGQTPAGGANSGSSPDDGAPSLLGMAQQSAPHPPPAAPTGPRVTGRVVDAAGSAVTGARVVAWSDASDTTFSLADAGTEGSRATATTCDAHGRFAIAVRDDAPFHCLFATSEGHGVGVRPSVASGSEVVLSLPRATAIVGTVADREGNPVVGARVRVLLLFDAMTTSREAASAEGGAYRVAGVPLVDAERAWGDFVVLARVEVLAEGYAPAFFNAPWLLAASAEVRLELVLSRGITVYGRVVDDESGAPIEGATVDLRSSEPREIYGSDGNVDLSPYPPPSLARATTDPDGAYRFEHVPGVLPHEQTRPEGASHAGAPPRPPPAVVAWKAGFSPQSAALVPSGDPATSQEYVLRLRRAGSVSGRVLDAAGIPVEGATVVAEVEGYAFAEGVGGVRLPPEAPRATATTDADGRFLLTGVPGRASEAVLVTVQTYRPFPDGALPGRSGRQAARVETHVEVGRNTDVGDLRLPPVEMGPTMRVRVLDAEGLPVWGAKVVAAWVEVACTDRAGEASWSHVAPTGASVRAVGFAPAQVPMPEPGGGSVAIEVRLERGRRVAGRVFRSDRTPAAGATVLVSRGTTAVAEAFPDPGSLAAGPNVLARVTAGDDGAFEVVDLPAGPWHLRATLPRRVGIGPDAFLLTRLSDVPSDATDVQLVLPWDDSPMTGRLEGRVVVPTEGEALERLSITLRRGEEAVGYAELREGYGELSPDIVIVARDGSFAFDTAPVGTVSLDVTTPGWLPQTVEGLEIREGATTVAPPIVLSRGIVLSGALRAEGVDSWGGRELRLRSLDDVFARSLSGAIAQDGTYRVSGLRPGTYEAWVQAGAHGSRVPTLLPSPGTKVVVPPGASELVIDLQFAAAGMISLSPTDPRLPPPPWQEDLRPTDAQAKFGAATRVRVIAADGTVYLDHTGVHQRGLLDRSGVLDLLPGRYVARIDYPGGESLEEAVTVEVGPAVFVHFRGR